MAKPPAGMILAAGLGTRLKPLTDLRPKPLMEVANKPIIYYLIRNLIDSGVRDIYINLYYKSEQLITAIRNYNLDANINFSLEEAILGTAGGVRRVINKFGLSDQELVIINGDIWCEFEIRPLLKSGHFATLLCAENRLVEGYVGKVAVDAQQRIVELGRFYKNDKEQKRRGFFTGVHILSAEALRLLSVTDYTCLVSQVYPQWLGEQRAITGHMVELCYEDLGSPERILKTNLDLLSRMRCSVLIDPSAIVEAGVELGPNVAIGARCHIKNGAKIRDSVVMSDTKIEKDEQLDCAIALLDARVFMKATRQ